MKKVLFLISFFVLLLWSGESQAQANVDLDTSFVTEAGFNNAVMTTAVQPDGKILVGGWFTTYQGISRSNIARLNADGSLDTSFNVGAGFDAVVYSIVLQADGKILVGGDFTSYNGITQNSIARLNADGSIDTSFNMGNGLTTSGGMAFVNTMAIQNDGKILVGGRFTDYNGTPRQRIARINTDGTIDTSFVVGSGFNADVKTIALQSDGKIVAGGSFKSYSFTNVNYIVRLNMNGTVDSSFNIGTGFGGSPGGAVVQIIVVQPDDKILVGGYFTTYKGTTQNRIVRLNTNGNVDTSFVAVAGVDNYFVNDIELQPDGKILLGGGFLSYNGIARRCLARINANGSLDTSFDIGTGFFGTLSNVETVSLQPDGKIVVGGYFTSYKGVDQNRIARLSVAGSLSASSFNTKEMITVYPNPVSENLHFSEEVSTIKILDISGKVIIQTFTAGKSFNVRKLVKGVYFVTATTKSGKIITHKVIKE